MQRISHIKVPSGMVFIDDTTDIYYLIGKKVSRGILLIFDAEAFFLVDARYIDACSNIDNVTTILAENGTLRDFLQDKKPLTVHIEEKKVSYLTGQLLKKILPEAKIENFTQMDYLRLTKDQTEIEKMRKAAKLNLEGCAHALSFLKEGITEKEIAWEHEKYCKERGGEELSFETIVGFGENTSYPHYHTADAKLKKGMAVLIDCGITLDSYTSDMTRSVFFKPESNPSVYAEWKKMNDHVHALYDGSMKEIKTGGKFSQLDAYVQNYCKKHEIDGQLRHTLGHSLGLLVHEAPKINYQSHEMEIGDNMIFTIEPGLYIPGKFGIRHENTVLYSGGKLEIFTEN